MPGQALGAGEGTVSQFDVEQGWGEIAGNDGATYGFHCTQIADRTRRIDAGSRVRFAVVAFHLGRYEAHNIVLAP